PEASSAQVIAPQTRNGSTGAAVRRVIVVRRPANGPPPVPRLVTSHPQQIRPSYQASSAQYKPPRRYMPSTMYKINVPAANPPAAPVQRKEVKEEPQEPGPSSSTSTYHTFPTASVGRPPLSGPKLNRVFVVSGTGASARIERYIPHASSIRTGSGLIIDNVHNAAPDALSQLPQLLPRPPGSSIPPAALDNSMSIDDTIMAVASSSTRRPKDAHPMLKEIGDQAKEITRSLRQKEDEGFRKFQEEIKAERERRIAAEEQQLADIREPTVYEMLQLKSGKRPASDEPYLGPEYFDRREVEELSRTTQNGATFLRILLDSLFHRDEQTRLPTYNRDAERIAYVKEIFFALRDDTQSFSKLLHNFNDNILRRRQLSTTWTETQPKLKLIHKKVKIEEE
ncbi:hypothetical protein PMAYCL1PPCAC_00771, partial [Pristionchus mayeri]